MQHPELTFRDVIDLALQLPEDTPFCRVVNRVRKERDVITTGQTSG
ncbi:hypothetical protein ACFLUO_05485 [Chloroflexota bacterium]